MNNQGSILEVLPESLTNSSNEILTLSYSLLDKNKLKIDADISFTSTNLPDSELLSRSSWGYYFKCVAKNTAGGVVGGAAAGCVGGYLAPAPAVCASGAGVGAFTGRHWNWSRFSLWVLVRNESGGKK